jgi:hypothetical protein
MRLFIFIGVATLALGCRTTNGKDDGSATDSGGLDTVDDDGDGYPASEDCDDGDASVHPGATEICDEVDNNCDGAVDEGVTDVWHADDDGDSYGDPDAVTDACSAPAGHVATGTDCDDADADVRPGATERCDGIDNDCDGEIDEDVQDAWYADADSDGFGDAAERLDDCDPPEGYVSDDTDCDDAEALAFPGNPEVCDAIDNDCNGLVDDGVLTTFYADTDGDGYGDDGLPADACSLPSGHAAVGGDCDDADAAVSPDATEVCDEIDNNCDGVVDEDTAADASSWYADADSDGYGDASVVTTACEAPSGTVSDATDCDDTEAAVNPGATEVCNTVDDDCDGLVDDADSDLDTSTASEWYADTDVDGYGDASVATTACDAPSGTVADDTDCDDTEAAVNPGATEVCNTVDDDCDGLVDDADSDLDTSTASDWYADTDLDGYGDASAVTTACDEPSGSVSDDTDCDDARADVYPGAPEACDGVDNDCSGALSWLEADTDGDGLFACETAVWLRTDDFVNNDPATTGYSGSADAADILVGAGFDWSAARLATVGLSSSWLTDVGMLIVVGRGDDGALSAAESADLQAWVEDGGSLFYTAYHPAAASCAMVNSLPTAFGVSCGTTSPYWSGTASNITAHAVTAGVTGVAGAGGELWTATSPALTVVDNGTWPTVIVVEPGAGRVVAVSDEWFLYNAGTGDADISVADNEQLVINVFDWLGDLPL